MNVCRSTAAAVGVVMLAGCSTTEWVHPNKQKEEFAIVPNESKIEEVQS